MLIYPPRSLLSINISNIQMQTFHTSEFEQITTISNQQQNTRIDELPVPDVTLDDEAILRTFSSLLTRR